MLSRKYKYAIFIKVVFNETLLDYCILLLQYNCRDILLVK